MQACAKLRSPDINHDLRIPDSMVIERIYQTMQVEEDGTINYNEFQTLVFKSTLEDSDWRTPTKMMKTTSDIQKRAKNMNFLSAAHHHHSNYFVTEIDTFKYYTKNINYFND